MNNGLKKKLLQMAARDQRMRKGNRWDKRVDEENTKKLKKIVKKYGWPDASLVGKKGATAAWLIAQHADRDVRFQRRCLKLMTDPSIVAYVSAREVAYLTDRVRVHQGKKQLYGTQLYRTRQGRLIPQPIANRKTLNLRRKKVGLESFEKYKVKLVKIVQKLIKE